MEIDEILDDNELEKKEPEKPPVSATPVEDERDEKIRALEAKLEKEKHWANFGRQVREQVTTTPPAQEPSTPLPKRISDRILGDDEEVEEAIAEVLEKRSKPVLNEIALLRQERMENHKELLFASEEYKEHKTEIDAVIAEMDALYPQGEYWLNRKAPDEIINTAVGRATRKMKKKAKEVELHDDDENPSRNASRVPRRDVKGKLAELSSRSGLSQGRIVKLAESLNQARQRHGLEPYKKIEEFVDKVLRG